MAEERSRTHFGDYLSRAETGIYSILAVLLCITALAAIAGAGKQLWDGLSHWPLALETLAVLNQLLIVLMLVEILHTVRVSIRSHFSGDRTFPGDRIDCFDPANAGHHSGNGHTVERRKMDGRWRERVPRFADRAWVARIACACPGVLDYPLAPHSRH